MDLKAEDRPTLVSDRDLLTDPVIAALLAHVPGVVVVLDHEAGDNALSYRSADGERTPRIALGPEVAFGPLDALRGAVAHEVAHHVLGHVDATPARSLARAGMFVLGGVPLLVCFLAGRELWPACAAVAAVYGILTLLANRSLRRVELAADAHSVHLLDAAGVDGRAVARASLTRSETWRERVATLWGTHPATAARLRAIARQR